jgi:phospholipid N-methyltransferase
MTSTHENDDYTPPEDLKARLAASYDVLAPTYNKWTLANPDPRIEWLSKVLGRLPMATITEPSAILTRHILELGAGAGVPTTQTILEYDMNIHVHANDLSTGQLDLLRRNLSTHRDRLSVLHGDMLSIDFEPGSLHAVIGMYSVIHLPQHEQIQLLERIGLWLHPGGLFLANFAVQEANEAVVKEWLDVEGAWMYWASLGDQGSKDAVRNAGLEILESAVVDGKGVDSDFVWILARKPLAK